MKNVNALIERSPHPETVERFLEDFDRKLIDALVSANKFRDFVFCIGASPYMAKFFVQNPRWVYELFLEDGLHREIELNLVEGEPFVDSLVKSWRKEHIKIGIRDLLRIYELPDVLKQLSRLADVTIERVCDYALSAVESRFGKCGIPYAVIALGKLGGEELNYYSDIDIMYLYEKNSSRIGSVTVHEFFTRFFTEVTKTL
ncbi:MAG: hypothetical protein GXO44_03130, partial [Deferribacteres bacterium]|nr:hypothetical protein [Deferribacteres bacterium]